MLKYRKRRFLHLRSTTSIVRTRTSLRPRRISPRAKRPSPTAINSKIYSPSASVVLDSDTASTSVPRANFYSLSAQVNAIMNRLKRRGVLLLTWRNAKTEHFKIKLSKLYSWLKNTGFWGFGVLGSADLGTALDHCFIGRAYPHSTLRQCHVGLLAE